MALNLLQIVQAAQAELGLPQSQSVIGNTDATTQQMLGLANRTLDEIRRMNRWTRMQQLMIVQVVEPTITTADTVEGSEILTNVGFDFSSYASQALVFAGQGLPIDARFVTGDSATQVTLNMVATSTATGVTITAARDTYQLPEDFDWFNNRTMWDRTNRWEMLGPDSPQMDQWHRSGIVATGPRRHFRQVSPRIREFRIWPPPFEITAPLQLSFEYLSTYGVYNEGSMGSFNIFFENDTDQPIVDDQAVILGIKWMFWEIKGFNYASMQGRWVDYVERLAARDGGAPTLNLAKKVHPIFVSPANVQDGFFPGPVGPNSA